MSVLAELDGHLESCLLLIDVLYVQRLFYQHFIKIHPVVFIYFADTQAKTLTYHL